MNWEERSEPGPSAKVKAMKVNVQVYTREIKRIALLENAVISIDIEGDICIRHEIGVTTIFSGKYDAYSMNQKDNTFSLYLA